MRLKICVLMIALAVSGPLMARQEAASGTAPGKMAFEVGAGVASPLKGRAFVKNFRPEFRLSLDRQLTPSFSIGAEASWIVNSSRWPSRRPSTTAVDDMYAGLYGTFDILRAVAPDYAGRWGFGLRAGAGWGHYFLSGVSGGHNFFATSAGMFARYSFTDRVALLLTPYVAWNMSDATTSSSSASYNARYAHLSVLAGLRYSFGSPFECMPRYDLARVDALNLQINTLRADCDKQRSLNAEKSAQISALSAQLEEASRARGVVKEAAVDNHLNTEFAVFFLKGSAYITPDQMPNLERIASYMKSHPGSTLEIHGYASPDGNEARNLKLARERSESIRDALVGRMGISPARIVAVGSGIGHMFEEESWNRVCICTIHG